MRAPGLVLGLCLLFMAGLQPLCSARPFAPTLYARLTLQPGAQGSGQAVTLPTGLAWYRFANHTHTQYSVDASATIEQRIRGAAAEGADAVSITDHGNCEACSDPIFIPMDGCVPMCGSEWGSVVDGDAGLLNLSPGPPIGGGIVAEMIPLALARGATIIANHPFIPSEPWGYEDLHLGIAGIEIWTTPLFVVSGSAQAVDWWHGLLIKGRMVFGIGGSDNHTDSPYSLQPCNYVLASSPQPGDLQQAVEARRISIAESATAPRCLIWCDADGDAIFESPVGSNVHVVQEQTLRFRVEAFGAQGLTLAVITTGPPAANFTVGNGDPWTADFTAMAGALTKDFVRAEIRTADPAHPVKAVTNPIYVNYTLDDADGDGIPDALELAFSTDMYSQDSDGDGVADGFEIGYDDDPAAYNPYDPASNPTGTDLNALDRDTDGDGVGDAAELTYGSNPLDPADVPQLPLTGHAPLAAVLLLLGIASRRRRAL